MSQPVDNTFVSCDKTTYRSKRFAESTHDEVHFSRKPKVITNTTSLTTKHTYTMCFVYHDGGIVLMFKFHDFGEIGQITFHGEHAIHHDKFHGFRSAFLKLTLQIGHIVMLILQASGEGQSAAIYNGSMVAVIANDVILATGQARNNAGVNRKTGRIAQSIFFSDKLGQLFLQFHVEIECTIQETRTRTTGAILLHCFDTGLNDALIARKSCISIRAKHQHMMAAHFNFCTLFAFDGTEIGIHTFCLILLG